MCGIAGIVKSGSMDLRNELEQMTRALSHRGPDEAGFYVHDNIGLGHRRLSIIDLQTGHQPLCNENRDVWITFNGEIYNYKELRKELIFSGHNFNTHSDTEVIVHAYEEWGEDCVKHFRGMFAFAILDQRKQEIFLARDHFGIKPLLYMMTDELFAFASEIQALRRIKVFNWEIDINALDQYLQFQFIPAPCTIYSQIRKLPAACFMRVDIEGNIIEIKRYWRLEFNPDPVKSEPQWLEELDTVLMDSVKAHLVSDVPFGAFLSGGIDSSTVVGYMAQLMNHPTKTFSIGFEENEFDETEYAREVAKKWETEHYEEIIKPNALNILPQLVQHYGEPFGDSSAIPTYYVSRLARQHVTMVLTGDAGDEIFAGYDSYTRRWHRHISPVPEHLHPVKKIAYRLLNAVAPNRHPLRTAGLADWLRYIQYFNDERRRQLWRPDIWHSLPQPNRTSYESSFMEASNFSHFQKAQYTDFNTYMVGDILAKVDVASMIHSLEARTPLLDIRVVEFASTIPEKFNIAKINDEWVGKLLMKKLGQRYYKKEFLYRSKMGFAVPVSKWLVKDGNAVKEIKDRLLAKGNGLDNLFNVQTIDNIINSRNAAQLWLLLFLQEWMSQQSLSKNVKSEFAVNVSI